MLAACLCEVASGRCPEPQRRSPCRSIAITLASNTTLRSEYPKAEPAASDVAQLPGSMYPTAMRYPDRQTTAGGASPDTGRQGRHGDGAAARSVSQEFAERLLPSSRRAAPYVDSGSDAIHNRIPPRRPSSPVRPSIGLIPGWMRAHCAIPSRARLVLRRCVRMRRLLRALPRLLAGILSVCAQHGPGHWVTGHIGLEPRRCLS